MVENDYMPIQSLDIEAETKITFDLYVNLPLNNKYILYRRKGGKLENSKIEFFNQANVHNFFVQKAEYNEFVKYVARRLKALIGTENTASNKKVMTAAAKAILSSTINQEDPAMVKALLTNLNDITSVIIEGALEGTNSYSKTTFRKLSSLAEKGTDFQKHPVNVTSLSVLIAFGIGYNSEKIISDLAVASLLHDIGLARLSAKVIPYAHDVGQLIYKDREEVYKHPELTLKILSEKGFEVSEMVKAVVLQHHEEFNGFGYPFGIRGYALNEFAQILRVADDLDHLISAGYSGTGNLRIRVNELFDHLNKRKIIEPSLLIRIRSIL